jgi:hypothetical protein
MLVQFHRMEGLGRGSMDWTVKEAHARLRALIHDLTEAAFNPLLIGGWAEELHGLVPPRPHEDVDVVLLEPNIARLDAFVAERNERVDGHLSHKRVMFPGGVKVELFIAERCRGEYYTVFWDRMTWQWPETLEPVDLHGLPVAPVVALQAFRRSYPHFIAVRDAAVSENE